MPIKNVTFQGGAIDVVIDKVAPVIKRDSINYSINLIKKLNQIIMKTITIEEVKAKLDAGEKINLLDVREPHEHAAFNIGGQLLPLGLVQALQLDEIEHLKEETIYVYCRSGNRSGQACLMLEPYGFKNVYNVVGGMLAWQEKFPA